MTAPNIMTSFLILLFIFQTAFDIPNQKASEKLFLPAAQIRNQFFQHGADGFGHQDLRGKGEAGCIVAVAFRFFLQNVQILDAFERKVLGEDKRDLFAPYQAQLGNGFAVF